MRGDAKATIMDEWPSYPVDAMFELAPVLRAVEGPERLGDEPVPADSPCLESADPYPVNRPVRPGVRSEEGPPARPQDLARADLRI